MNENKLDELSGLLEPETLSDTAPITKEEETLGAVLPLLALRGLCVYPGVFVHFDVGRPKSVKALESAMASGKHIFLVAQKDMKTDEVTRGDLYDVGTISKIRQILRLPGDNIRVLVEGVTRARLEELVSEKPFYTAKALPIPKQEECGDELKKTALLRALEGTFDVYAMEFPKMSKDIAMEVLDAKDTGFIADYLGANLQLSLSRKQELLEILSPEERLEQLLVILEQEIELIDIEKTIQDRTREQIDKGQREYYLREQLRAIQGELGEGDVVSEDCDQYRKKIQDLSLAPSVEERLMKEVDRLSKMSYTSSEGSVIRSYLDVCLEFPWNIITEENPDLAKAKRVLERDHFGMTRVKERILEFLAVKQLNPDLKNQILCLVGPPGVGKTSIARSIAETLGRNYARISLGGVRDEADIRGHRKTYIGAMPGRVIHALTQSKSMNPVLLLDEIDKMATDFRGDPGAALLEVLDGEQNNAFVDHYMELPVDLSQVLFITTANSLDSIPRPLLDRMEIISLPSYTAVEKGCIAKKYLLPKQMKRHGLLASQLKINDRCMQEIIAGYTKEAGVRTLERTLATLCRKIAMRVVEERELSLRLHPSDLEELLGAKRYLGDDIGKKDEVGLVCGLAWTAVGGETLFVEVNVMEGTGKTECTGQLGDVMKESVRAAISYLRSRGADIGIDSSFYKNKDLHIHFPEGAIPKDGPSAGITTACAILSALTGIAVHHDVAMTGEITLRGRVLRIGGLREKAMAAYSAGIKTVLIPKDNFRDLEEVDEKIKENITFIPVATMDEVIAHALCEKPKKRKITGETRLKKEETPLPLAKEPSGASNREIS